MPRKNLIRTNQFYYHITTRANHKHWFTIPLNQVWMIVISSFKKAQQNHPAEVSQFVLMSNHYHLLIRTPNSDIDKFMYFFNKEFSRQLRLKSGLTNRMFGGNYKWSIINSERYLRNVFRYIYQNPVRAGLVSSCEDYTFSTFHHTFHSLKVPFNFVELDELETNIDFINDQLSLENNDSIRKGLRKSIFKEVNKLAR